MTKCIKKCKLNQTTLICEGCGRTLMEIVDAGNAYRENEAKGKAQGNVVQIDRDSSSASKSFKESSRLWNESKRARKGKARKTTLK